MTPQLGRNLTHFICPCLMVFCIAVGKVKPNYVRTSSNNLFQIIVAVGSRTQCGNDFGSSEPSGHVLLR
ncbi:hypothetical protein D3C75_721510 [compost metagenome]